MELGGRAQRLKGIGGGGDVGRGVHKFGLEKVGGVGLGLVHGLGEGGGGLSSGGDRLSVSIVRAGCWCVRWGNSGSNGRLLGE